MPVPPFKRGEQLLADRLNREFAPLDRMRAAGAEVGLPQPLPTVLQVPGLWCEVVAEQNDYLKVKQLNGSTDDKAPSSIYIAKPFKLRHDADYYEGVASITTNSVDSIDATGGSTTETWLVVPSYQVGDQVYAIYTNGTGVSVNDEPLALIDANTDGRAWAKESA